MIWQDRIIINPRNSAEKPFSRRPRVPVEFVIELMANGYSEEYILFNYPQISREDIQACLKFSNNTE
jgi:uncharacterized protein (DUF433 family)